MGMKIFFIWGALLFIECGYAFRVFYTRTNSGFLGLCGAVFWCGIICVLYFPISYLIGITWGYVYGGSAAIPLVTLILFGPPAAMIVALPFIGMFPPKPARNKSGSTRFGDEKFEEALIKNQIKDSEEFERNNHKD